MYQITNGHVDNILSSYCLLPLDIFISIFSEKFTLHIKTFENISENCCWDFPWVTRKVQLKNLHENIYQTSVSGLKHCCNFQCAFTMQTTNPHILQYYLHIPGKPNVFIGTNWTFEITKLLCTVRHCPFLSVLSKKLWSNLQYCALKKKKNQSLIFNLCLNYCGQQTK